MTKPENKLKIKYKRVLNAYFAERKDEDQFEESGTEPKIHTVVKGDLLSTIAPKYGTTVDKIMADNPSIKNKNNISIGQKIKIGTEPVKKKTGSKVTFSKVNSASLGQEVYVVVETQLLQGNNIAINVKHGKEDCTDLETDGCGLMLRQGDKASTKVVAKVGDFANEEGVTNCDDFNDLAIFKFILGGSDLTDAAQAIDNLEGKKAFMFLLVDAHSEDGIKVFYNGLNPGPDGKADQSSTPNHWLDVDGKWFSLQNGGVCGGKGCIKDGDENKLVQEINIRLAGFGGNVPTEKFSDRTVAMIKQFQKDYMEVDPTGKVCGDTLAAIDEFETKYPIKFSQLKCECGTCTGFGQGKFSEQKQLASKAERSRKYEYPGIHRSLLWAYKAMMFYMAKKEDGKFTINKISSGYRCHVHNGLKGRTSTNHMGKAIDIIFNKNNVRTKAVADVEKIRDKIIIPTNKAQIRWSGDNLFSLEPSKKRDPVNKPNEHISTSWIHMDVREFDLEYLKDEFFANTEAKIKGDKIVDVAKNEGFSSAVECKGGGFTSQEGSESKETESNDCQAKFDKMAPIILEHEGGYVNHAADKGGATNKGITIGTWKKYAKEDCGVEPTLANLKTITDDQASKIYRKRYWEPKGFCKVEDNMVGLMVYDWTITSGGAGKQVQQLLVDEFSATITVDGAIGPNTIKAINAASDQAKLLKRVGEIRKQYYTNLTFTNGKKNSQDVFLKGWHNRVDKCLNANI